MEGATALERLIHDYKRNTHGWSAVLIDAARAEAANRRPATGKEGDVRMPEREETKLTSPESTPASRGAIPSTTGEDERVAVAVKELFKLFAGAQPLLPDREEVEAVLRHLPAPSHSEVELESVARSILRSLDWTGGNDENNKKIIVSILNGESK